MCLLTSLLGRGAPVSGQLLFSGAAQVPGVQRWPLPRLCRPPGRRQKAAVSRCWYLGVRTDRSQLLVWSKHRISDMKSPLEASDPCQAAHREAQMMPMRP